MCNEFINAIKVFIFVQLFFYTAENPVKIKHYTVDNVVSYLVLSSQLEVAVSAHLLSVSAVLLVYEECV